MTRKSLIIVLVALTVLAGLLIGLYFGLRPQVTEGTKSFTLTVVHSDGSTKDFPFTTDKEYVGEVVQEGGLVTGVMGDYGLYIQNVDGETAIFEENGAYWAFYEGDAYAATGIDQTPIQDGAVYKLVYTAE